MFLRSNTRIKDGKEHRYYTVVESRRLQSGKVAQRQVLYLGEINDSQQAAWRKTLEVFDEGQNRYTPLSLFPEDRPVPADAIDSVQVKLSEMKLERARPYGNCWLGCELWRQLHLDRFWSGKLPSGREAVAWPQVLELLVVNRLIDAGVEGEEITFAGAAEDQAAGGGEHSGPRRGMHLELPAHLAGGRVERADGAGIFAVRKVAIATAGEKCPRLVFGLALVIARAQLAHRDIEQLQRRTVCRAEPDRSE